MTQKGCPSLFSALRKSSSPKLHPKLQEFESKLAKSFDTLTEAGEKRDSMFLSTDWLLQALSVAQTTHADALELAPSLTFNKCAKWLDEYLDDTAKLLDVCIVLKEGIEVMDEYQSMMELAIYNVQDKSDCSYYLAHRALQDFIEKIDTEYPAGQLESCTTLLCTTREKLVKPKAKDAARGNGFLHAIYAAKVTTLFVCGLVVTALACKPKWRSLVMSPHHISSQCLWASSLLRLHQRVPTYTEGSFELGRLGTVNLLVRHVHGIMDRKRSAKGAFDFSTEEAEHLRLSATSLASALESLRSRLPSLHEGVDKLFRLLVATRNKLLLANVYNNNF